MNFSNDSLRISYLRICMLFGLYILLVAIFSVKTIYYYNSNTAWWWGYFSLLTISFLYFSYHSLSSKPHWIWLLVFLSFFLGYFPLEVVVPELGNLVINEGRGLSDLAKKFPHNSFGVLVDILFYPLLMSILLLTTKVVAKKL